MADLTADDVVVNLPLADRHFPPIPIILSFPTITFGDGAKTYPAGGVPLPTVDKFGVGALKRLHIQQPPNGYVYKYDPDNHKLLVLQGDYTNAADGPLVEISGAPTQVSLKLTVYGE